MCRSHRTGLLGWHRCALCCAGDWCKFQLQLWSADRQALQLLRDAALRVSVDCQLRRPGPHRFDGKLLSLVHKAACQEGQQQEGKLLSADAHVQVAHLAYADKHMHKSTVTPSRAHPAACNCTTCSDRRLAAYH